MRADGPATKIVEISVHYAIRIVTGQAECSVRAVAHQKVLHDWILTLNVRIVTGIALHITVHELHGRVRRVRSRRGQEHVDFWRVREWSLHTDRMRTAKISPELGSRAHRPSYTQ